MEKQVCERDQIISKLRGHTIFKSEPKISFVLLGGSIVSQTNGWWSDVDIFIFLRQPKSSSTPTETDKEFLDLQIDLSIKLGDILSTDRVQVSILNTLPLMVQFEVLKNYYPLFIYDSEIFFQYKEKTLKQAIDFSIWQTRWLDESLTVNQK